MNSVKSVFKAPIHWRRYIWVLTLCWTAAIAATLTWEIYDEYRHTEQVALSEAHGAWERDAAILRWGAGVGGVYVPPTASPPDANLTHLSDRDVTTQAGKKLTLVNPIAMLRDIREARQKDFGIKDRITSLKPVDPANAPDRWERDALEAFAAGQAEVYSLETTDGQRHLRFMRPLFAEDSCLKCHAEQGYKVGDIRGGISVTVKMSAVWPFDNEQIVHRLIGYGGMWLLGLAGIVTLSRQLQRQIERRYEAEQQLQETNERLDQRVAERTAELATVNKELANEIAERKQAEQWLLESEQRFRGYFEQGLVGMAILSSDLEWVEVNQRFCKLFGYSEEELQKKRWSELTHPEDRATEEEQFQQMLGGVSRGFHLTKRIVRKDGVCRSVSISVQCMRRDDDSVDCVLTLVHER